MAESKKELNVLLREAICSRNTHELESLLSAGADPNFCLPKEEYAHLNADYEDQPYSPLRLLVFIISDSLISDKELLVDARAAKLLLDHGADPLPAIELAEKRYGKFEGNEEEAAFTKVLKIIYSAG